MAAQLDQRAALLLGFHAFGDGLDAQRAGQRQDRAHQRQALRSCFGAQSRYEAAVDLQHGDREPVQVRQRREAGAEVVQLRQDAVLAQRAQDAQRARGVVEQRDLGDLQPQPGRIGAMGLEHRQQAIAEVGRTEMPRRHVHRDVAVHAPRDLPHHLLVQQPVDLFDQAAVLAQADELGRQQQATALVLPAQPRLVADHPPVVHAADGLVERQEIAMVDRAAQVGLQIQALHRRFAHGFVEHGAAVAPLFLGAVHRRIGIAQQLFAIAIARVPHGDAQAGGGKQFAAGHPHRPPQHRQQALGEVAHVLHAVRVFHQQGELVAAQARDHVVLAHAHGDAPRDLHQQFVAGGVAHAVVDQLEAVQVEEQHGEGLAVAMPCALDGGRQPVQQVRTVGQTRQRIVGRLVGELLLGTQALTDLCAQLVIGLGQFAGAFVHPALQFGVRAAQAFMRALPVQSVADVVGHERQQVLVVRGELHFFGVALHHHRADHVLAAEQRHAQPAVRRRPVLLQLALLCQLGDHGAVGQQRPARGDHVLGQAIGHAPRLAHRVALVDRVREAELLTVVRDQGDIEVPRVDQFVHHHVDVGIETLEGIGGDGELGDAEQRALQLLGTLALHDLGLQLAVGALQLVRAYRHAMLQLHVRVLAVQRGQDVLGHVAQQRAILVGIAGGRVVALHDDGAADAVVAAHGHAQPVQAVRPVRRVADHAQLLPDHRRRSPQGLAVAQQRERHAVGHFLFAELALRFGHVRIALVREVQEADRAALVVVEDDVAVLRIHQRVHHRMDAAEHLGHLQVGTGQIGDLVEGLLQPLGLLQGHDARLRARGVQRGFHQGTRQRQPCRFVLGRPGVRSGYRQRHAGVAVGIVPGVHAEVRIVVLGRVGQRLVRTPPQRRRCPRRGRAATAQRPVAPAHRQLRARRQQATQDRRDPLCGRRGRAGRIVCADRWRRHDRVPTETVRESGYPPRRAYRQPGPERKRPPQPRRTFRAVPEQVRLSPAPATSALRSASRARLVPAAAACPSFTRTRGPLTLVPVNDLAEPADETLMLAYASGDASAFEQLYARHRGPLYRFLLRHLRDAALADEFFQDTWQRVIAARQGWKPEAAFGTWLYRIAHNRLNDHWRALKHRPPAPEDAEARTERVPDPDTPERQLSQFEQRRRLQLAMDELPPEQREVLLLRLEQELTLEEIGEITGVGRETVKSRLRYAMDRLRTRLNE